MRLRFGLIFQNNIYSYVHIKKDTVLLSFVFVSTVASGVIPAALSILTGRIFDLLGKYMTIANPVDELRIRSMLILALGAASLIIIWICIASWMLLGERQNFEVRTRLMDSYFQKPIEWYDANDNLSGELTQTNRCVEELRSSSSEASALTWKNLVTILALTITSFYYSWSLTLVTMCGGPIIILGAVFFSRKIHIYSEKENEHTAIASQLFTWSMEATALIRLSCMQIREIKNFRRAVEKCSKSFIRMCLYSSTNIAVLKFLTLVMFIQAFWFGGTMVQKHSLNITDVITCFQACVLLGATVTGTLHQIVVLQKGKVGVEKINKLLEQDHNSNGQLQSSNFFRMNDAIYHEIEFHNVQFNYPSRPTVAALKNITLTLQAGRITYIVGKSGSGKSSLCDLLLKFYDDYNGTIKIGGIDIKSIEQQSILENVTLVEQRCTLFNTTLRNNILFGSKEKDDIIREDRLKAACRISLLENFICDLPDGLETLIGTGGIMPSGGQQQRIAIARAFMRDTPILILDEAACALDSTHRDILMKEVRSWRRDKTTFILTHDLNEIESDDMIHVLEDGEVVERGLKRELLSQRGKFFDMANISVGIDLADSYSAVSTIAVSDHKTDYIYEDSWSEYEIETPRIDVDSGNLESISDLPLEWYPSSQGDKSRPGIVTHEEHSNSAELNYYEEGSKGEKNHHELMSISEIMKRMYKGNTRKFHFYLGVCCSIYAGISNPIFSYTFSYLLNGIIPSGEPNTGSPGYLLKWSFIVMGIAAADSGLTLLKEFILGYYSEVYIASLRDRAMARITYKCIAWFSQESNRPSELCPLLMNDLRDLRTLVSKFIGAASSFMIISSVGLIWAISTGWKLSLVCISMFPLLIICSMLYGRLLKKYETSYKSAIVKVENLQYEVVSSMKTIRCLQIEEHFKNKFNELEMKAKLMGRNRAIVTALGVAVSSALTMTLQGILYYYAISLVINGEYTTKKMLETFTLLLFTIMTCNSLMNQLPDIRRGQRAASKIYRILDDVTEMESFEIEQHREDQIIESRTLPIIRFNNLSFAYPEAPATKILNRLNMEIYSGDRIAIVGESGCGKSTLVNIITKFYECASNSLFVDGTDVNDWSLFKLREQIAVVEQKPTLFKGTIRENLMYGPSKNITEMDVFNTLKYVGIYDFVIALPEGLETKIDSQLLSGGQNQRLCIARALLQRPKILILDECTSSLDVVSSHIINEILAKGPPALVTISITHDEQMIRACSKVAVLHQGRIVELGTPGELLGQKSRLSQVVTMIDN